MIRTLAYTLAFLTLASVANAEYSTSVEQDAGCPVVLPTFPVANTNVVILDRSQLSRDCLIALRDFEDSDEDDDDDEE